MTGDQSDQCLLLLLAITEISGRGMSVMNVEEHRRARIGIQISNRRLIRARFCNGGCWKMLIVCGTDEHCENSRPHGHHKWSRRGSRIRGSDTVRILFGEFRGAFWNSHRNGSSESWLEHTQCQSLSGCLSASDCQLPIACYKTLGHPK